MHVGEDSITEEPALQMPSDELLAEPSEHEVWQEPFFAKQAFEHKLSPYNQHLRHEWSSQSPLWQWTVITGLLFITGLYGIPLAFFQELATGANGFAAVVIVAPIVEELCKVMLPLIICERKPFWFPTGWSVVGTCAIGGLFFAAVENLLYIYWYMDAPTPTDISFRWTVCSALHIACSFIVGLGLRRVWLQAKADVRLGQISDAAPFFITAMILHGSYNFIACWFTLFNE